MTPIETIAAIFGIIVVIKMLGLLFAGKQFLNFFRPLLKWVKKSYWPVAILMLIMLGILANYIFEVLGIVEVTAVLMFAAILYGFTLIQAIDIEKMANDMVKKNTINKMWLPMLIWLFLGLWVLYTLFM